MNRKQILGLFACATLCVASFTNLQAQNAPATSAPPGAPRQGGFGRGSMAPPGPPAFVPPQVAMARPTQAEVDRINAALREFIEKSSEKELLKKYESLVTVQVPRENSAIRPVQTRVRSDQRHSRFVEIAQTNNTDILFVGDSITDWWQQGGQGGGADVQKKHFGDINIANFAIAGDTTQGVLWGLKNGEGQGHKPKAVMVMIGTNNTGGNTGPEIAEGVGAVVHQLRTDFPNAKILLLAIFPRGAGPNDSNRAKNEEANKIIAKLHDGQHVFFKNINDKFFDAEGRMIGFRPDNLHPNAEGYEIWAQEVAPILKSWLN